MLLRPRAAGEGLRLKLAEVGFAVGGEDGGDGEAGAGLDVGVEVEELPAEAGGEQAADGGFAGAHEAGEDEAAKVGGRDGGGGGLRGLVSRRGRRLGRSLRLLVCDNSKSKTGIFTESEW